MAVQTPLKISGKSPALRSINITDFKAGVNSYLDVARLPRNSLRRADNMMLDQDGIPKPRWGSMPFGDVLEGQIDGDDKFSKFDSDTRTLSEWNIAVADGKINVAKNGIGWEVIDGVTLTPGYDVSFLQLEDKVFIANGQDPLAFYDIPTNIAHSFTPIDTPVAPTLSKSTGLESGDINLYYRISAVNDVGETMASPAGTIAVKTAREAWKNPDDNSIEQSITLVWSEVDGAVRYNIYFSDSEGQECYIDSVAATTYTDEGRAAVNVAAIAPPDDTTGGPIVSDISYSDNRIFATGDPAHPYRVYWGGVGNNATAFSAFFGGGWIDISRGGPEIPVAVRSYRDGKGDPINTVFMTSANGQGSQQQIGLSSMTVGLTTFIVPMVARVIGSLGTSAPNSVIEAKNNLFYLSTQSINTTGAKPDMLNVLSTDEITLAIRRDVRAISNQLSKIATAIYFEGKIFWAVPNGASHNNEIWVIDLEIKSWMRPWILPVKKFISYTGDDGKERLLFRPSSGNTSRLIELSVEYDTDSNLPFNWVMQTGIISFGDSHMEFERVKKIYFEFLRARGNIDIVIRGDMKNKDMEVARTFRFTANDFTAGLDSDIFDDSIYDEAEDIPIIMTRPSLKKVIKILRTLNNISVELHGNSKTQFMLSAISILGTLKQTSDPSSWRRR